MKPKDIRELSLAELEKKNRDTRQELLHLRMRKQMGQVEDTSQLQQLKRDIARFETIRREKTATAHS